jgi:hypothetical protein
MPIILATQEAEIRKIAVQSQSRQIVLQDLISKKPFTKRAAIVAQGIDCTDPEFKSQYFKKERKKEKKTRFFSIFLHNLMLLVNVYPI